jgi:hypothetical protein
LGNPWATGLHQFPRIIANEQDKQKLIEAIIQSRPVGGFVLNDDLAALRVFGCTN